MSQLNLVITLNLFKSFFKYKILFNINCQSFVETKILQFSNDKLKI